MGRVPRAIGLLLLALVVLGCPRRRLPVENPRVLLERCEAEIRAGDVEDAFGACEHAARARLPEAQLQLAHMYRLGEGVLPNRTVATNWYRRAAEAGLVEAQWRLAESYARGEGSLPDPERAARWYRAAAEGGHAEAQYVLARRVDEGRDGAADAARATHWYRLAAEQGHARAQYALGARYVAGVGVTRNWAEAWRWLLLAGERGVADAETARRMLEPRLLVVEGRVGVGRAAVWRESHEAGEVSVAPLGETDLAQLYYEQAERSAAGVGRPVDLERATRNYRRAAEAGHLGAQVALGLCYARGRGVPREPLEAHLWLSVAVARGARDPRAHEALSEIEGALTRREREAARRRAERWLATQTGS